jgi:hypothetical protein
LWRVFFRRAGRRAGLGFVWQICVFGGVRGCGRRWWRRRGRAFGAEVLEAGEGTFELAIVTRFVAVDEFEGARFVGHGAEGDEGLGGQAGGGGELGLVDFEVESGGFHVPEAHLAPAGYGHVFDERFLGGGFRLMLFLEGGEEFDEGFARFVFEDDGFREDSVTEAVARGGEFALRGFGAAGFSSVGTGGGDLEFGRHWVF